MEAKLVFLLFAGFALTNASIKEDKEDLNQLLRILSKPRELDRNKPIYNEINTKDGGVLGFSYKNCGSAGDLATVNKLTIGPDPIEIPGNLTIAVDVVLKEALQSPVKLDLDLKKKVFIWIDIPCIDDLGSCTYDDVCTLIPQGSCPPEFQKYKIPCQCPVKPGHYAVPTATIALPDISLPSILSNGDYQITAKASMGGKQVLCAQLELSLKANNGKK